MPTPIAFVSKSGEEKEAEWLHALSEAMPEETIRAFSSMSATEKEQAEVAIVANPDPQDITALPNLKWIHSLWAGVERLVAELGEKAPPIVRLVDPEMARTMAEAVLAWVYYLQRDMPAYRHNQTEKRWQPLPYRPPSSLCVGILGLGVLGKAAAAALLRAGFHVAGWSRSKKTLKGVETYSGTEGLDTMLRKGDIVVLLLPLTNDTHKLIDKTRFATMKKGAALINFARAPIIDSGALLDALGSGHLSHAVLDVFTIEPLPESCPFWHDPNITVLPHISAKTTRKSASAVVAKNLADWRKRGKLPQTVDVQRGY